MQCPKCGRDMRLQKSSKNDGKFWGCTGYKEGVCSHTEPYDPAGAVVAELTGIKKCLGRLGQLLVAMMEHYGIEVPAAPTAPQRQPQPQRQQSYQQDRPYTGPDPQDAPLEDEEVPF